MEKPYLTTITTVQQYKFVMALADAYGIDYGKLWGAYTHMLIANFEQDLVDLAKELASEEGRV